MAGVVASKVRKQRSKGNSESFQKQKEDWERKRMMESVNTIILYLKTKLKTPKFFIKETLQGQGDEYDIDNSFQVIL